MFIEALKFAKLVLHLVNTPNGWFATPPLQEAVRECKMEESRVCEPLAASCQEEVEVCAVEKVKREVCH